MRKMDFRKARRSLGLTQGELSERAGISQQHLSGIEKGDIDPRLSTCEAIADGMGMSVALVRKGEDDAEG